MAASGSDEATAAGIAGDTAEGDTAPVLDAEAMRELARELYWFQDENGMWIIHAKLPPEQGQLVMKALRAVARPLAEERQDDWQARQKARMQAVARKLLQRGGAKPDANSESGAGQADPGVGAEDRTSQGLHAETSTDRVSPGLRTETAPDSSSPEVTSASPVGEALPDHLAYARAEEKISAELFSQHMNQVRADALVAMVEHFLASGPDYRGLQGLKGAERCQVVMHVDVNTLRAQRSGVCCTHGRAHFEDKPWL
ncbi:MAG: hypothetical protein R6W80_07350, partial [Haliea sp.]